MEKKCFKCGEIKNFSEFYKHKEMADGYFGKCKTCTKIDSILNRKINSEYYREYEKKRFQTPERKVFITKNTRRYRKENPEKYKAQSIVGYNIKIGKLVKQPCSICGELKVHAHHYDYSKPLDVVWLCAKHHKEIHRRIKCEE